MTTDFALKRLLSPSSLAVFGGDYAAAVVRECQAIGYGGEIWAVNPHRADLQGVLCVDSVSDLPGPPDASFIAVPARAAVDIVRALAEIHAGGAICYSSGFAELGAEGSDLQHSLVEAAAQMPVIGPNCHGALNYLDGVALWPDQHGGQRVESGVAIILQSGNIGINLTMQRRGLAISYVISVGNKAALGVHDYIDYLLGDSRVTAIGLHIESLENVPEFSAAAIRALRRGVPLVAIKTGRSQLGAAMTMSHTSSLAGADVLYGALFRRLGIARAETLPEFLETLKFVSVVGTLPGRNIASMSCSGGEASIVADRAESLGLNMPAPGVVSEAGLRAVLGKRVHIGNPLDYHTYIWADLDRLTACFSAMLSNGYDCTVLVLDYPAEATSDTSEWEITERALIAATLATGQRAVVVATLPENFPAAARDRLLSAGIAPMQGIEECLLAIRAAAFTGVVAERHALVSAVAAVALNGNKAIVCDEARSKAELSAFGLPIPSGYVCSAAEATDTAEALGFPVVVKALSTEIPHKSEAGAVRLNVGDRDGVRAAVGAMVRYSDRFLVEEMVASPVAELIIGVNRDPQFGLTLLLGAGGTLVELLDDTASLLLPTTREEIVAALATLKIAKVVYGYRGAAAGDIDALVDAVEAVVAYANANSDSLIELDVNPLLVMADGAVAADAFIRKTRP